MGQDYFATESDFATWPTRDFGGYTAHSGWPLEPRSRDSLQIETWKIDDVNMTLMVAAVYGSEFPQERMDAIEHLRSLHIDYPHIHCSTGGYRGEQ